jgi:hypothetical protein
MSSTPHRQGTFLEKCKQRTKLLTGNILHHYFLTRESRSPITGISSQKAKTVNNALIVLPFSLPKRIFSGYVKFLVQN